MEGRGRDGSFLGQNRKGRLLPSLHSFSSVSQLVVARMTWKPQDGTAQAVSRLGT